MNTRSGVFGHFSRIDLCTFQESYLHFSRNGETQSRINAQWRLQHTNTSCSTNFYNEWVKSELLQDDLLHLGGDFGHGLEPLAR